MTAETTLRKRDANASATEESSDSQPPSHSQTCDNNDKCDDDKKHQAMDPNNPYMNKPHHVGRGEKAGERCRKFLSSPQWKLAMLSIVAFTPIYGCWSFLPTACDVLEIESFWIRFVIVGVGYFVSTQFIYNFASAQWTNAGGCKTVKPDFEVSGQFEMVFADEPGVPENKQVDRDTPIMYAPNWCNHCNNWKPPRAHHCSFCKRCVLRMDHHCPFTGNCIGFRNHGHFVLMYIFAMFGLCWSGFFLLLTIYYYPTSPMGQRQHDTLGEVLGLGGSYKWTTGITGLIMSAGYQLFLRTNLSISLMTVANVLAMLAVFGFGTPAVTFALKNITVLEYNLPMKEYVEIKSQVYCPLGVGFYNRGIAENFTGLLGPGWRWRLIMPTKAGGPNMRLATSPRPSLEGAQALIDRCVEVRDEGVKKSVESCADLGINLGPGNNGNVV